MTGRLTAIGVGLAAGIAAAQVPRPLAQPPVTLEFDTCVLPDARCPAGTERLTLLVHGRTLVVTLESLRVVTSTQPRGTMRVMLTERPLRVYAPDALLVRLVPGARLHVRATTRLHTRDLLLQSLQPRDDAAPEASHE